MQNLLLNIIKKFDKEEVKRWQNFIKSPYFNTNTTVIKICDFFAKIYPNIEKFDKEKLSKKLYPTKKYANNLLNTNINRLEQLTFRFLAQEMLEEQKILEDYFMIRYLCSEKFVDVSDLVDKKWEQSYKNIELNYTNDNTLNKDFSSLKKRKEECDDEVCI